MQEFQFEAGRPDAKSGRRSPLKMPKFLVRSHCGRRALVAGFLTGVSLLTPFVTAHGAVAQTPVSLMSSAGPTAGWTFSNGPEFPGASGALAADGAHDGTAALKLSADFTGGGHYVAATTPVAGVEIGDLALWVRNPGFDQFKVRIVDTSGQTHQFALLTPKQDGWQHIDLPLAAFFAKGGGPATVPEVARYQYFGGDNDGTWHGPAQSLMIMARREGTSTTRALWFSGVSIAPPPPPITATIPLDTLTQGATDWKFEKAGKAGGSLQVIPDQPLKGQSCLQFSADLTAKGASFASITRDFAALNLVDVTAIHFQVKSSNTTAFGVQLLDSTGQLHQRKGFKVIDDGAWHDITIEPLKVAGGEHWGGANDGVWHGPPTSFSIRFNAASSPQDQQPSVTIANIRADVVQPPGANTAQTTPAKAAAAP